MKVILRQEMKNLGKEGDLVEVADGYGRNYLLPRGLALEATPRNLKLIEEERRKKLAKQEREKKESEQLAQRLESLSLTIARQAGEEDKLFGSVTSQDIAEALKAQGFEIDKRKIELKEPLKSLGVYNVPVKLYKDVTVNLKVWVVKG